ncbi:MAG: phenylacetate--CoA ligase [Actinobacteria bacterium]|nr:phenylacetate--CoA ligase [Actinomycetota bacterium]
MTPEEYGRGLDSVVGAFVEAAAAKSTAFFERLESAGLVAAEMRTVQDLSRLPVLSKDDLLQLQIMERPFGGLLAEGAAVRRLFQSPGPLYEPELDRTDPWRWAPALRAAGFESNDIVLNAFGYHLSPAGAMFEEGARAVGCAVLPGGVGNMDLQVQACADLGITAFIGLPSYLKALLEKAEAIGVDLQIHHAFVTAEPLPPSLRSWLEERVSSVRQGYGTAETGNLGYECERAEGLHVPDDALVQVCDPVGGEPLWNGEEGQVVVTLFEEDYPLVRFGTGDLSRFIVEPCGCRRATPRLAGWLGRVGDAVKVRGMFLHPAQAERALAETPGLDSFRFVIDRVEHRDELRCEIVAEEGIDESALSEAVEQKIRSALRFRVDVQVVGDLPGDGIIDDRRTWE